MGAYEDAPGRVRFLAESFNILFRIDLIDGTRRALRVSPELRIHPDGTENLEATWLDEIREQTSINVPIAYRNDRGEIVTEIISPGVDGARTCVLFDWVGGKPLAGEADVDRMRRAGVLLAELHEHAAHRGDLEAPRGSMVADRVLHFEVENRLEGCCSSYGSVLDEALGAAQSAIDALWASPPHRPHLLHGDFTWHNVVVGRDGLTVIDFQDLLYGFTAFDVVNALHPLEHTKDSEPLAEALMAGYSSVRPWPIEDPQLFGDLIAARRLTQVNLGLNLRKPGLKAHLDHHVGELRRWLAGNRS